MTAAVTILAVHRRPVMTLGAAVIRFLEEVVTAVAVEPRGTTRMYDFDRQTNEILESIKQLITYHSPPGAGEATQAEIWIQERKLHILPDTGGLLVVDLGNMDIQGLQFIYGDEAPYPD